MTLIHFDLTTPRIGKRDLVTSPHLIDFESISPFLLYNQDGGAANNGILATPSTTRQFVFCSCMGQPTRVCPVVSKLVRAVAYRRPADTTTIANSLRVHMD